MVLLPSDASISSKITSSPPSGDFIFFFCHIAGPLPSGDGRAGARRDPVRAVRPLPVAAGDPVPRREALEGSAAAAGVAALGPAKGVPAGAGGGPEHTGVSTNTPQGKKCQILLNF